MEALKNFQSGEDSAMTPKKIFRFVFPIDVDTRSLLAFVKAMGWSQYVVEEGAEINENPDIFADFRNLKPDNRPYEELYDEMYQDKFNTK